MTRWTDEEIDFVRKYYTEMSMEDMGKYLGRSTAAIRRKAHDLGLGDRRWETKEVDPEEMRKSLKEFAEIILLARARWRVVTAEMIGQIMTHLHETNRAAKK